MRTYHREYKVLTCFECFEGFGKMCHTRDNQSMEPWTSSDREGHGLCCRPDSDDPYCVSGDELACSQPVVDSDPDNSLYKDILSPGLLGSEINDVNRQMFAYCVGTTREMCGLSIDYNTGDILSERDMTVVATFEDQVISTNQLRYIEEVPLPDNVPAYDSCYYEIKGEVSSEKMDELYDQGMDSNNIQLEIKIIKAEQMNVYVYGGQNRFEATTNIVPSNTPSLGGDIYYIDYNIGVLIVAYPNEDEETEFEFQYKLVSYAREQEEIIETIPDEEAESEITDEETEPGMIQEDLEIEVTEEEPVIGIIDDDREAEMTEENEGSGVTDEEMQIEVIEEEQETEVIDEEPETGVTNEEPETGVTNEEIETEVLEEEPETEVEPEPEMEIDPEIAPDPIIEQEPEIEQPDEPFEEISESNGDEDEVQIESQAQEEISQEEQPNEQIVIDTEIEEQTIDEELEREDEYTEQQISQGEQIPNNEQTEGNIGQTEMDSNEYQLTLTTEVIIQAVVGGVFVVAACTIVWACYKYCCKKCCRCCCAETTQKEEEQTNKREKNEKEDPNNQDIETQQVAKCDGRLSQDKYLLNNSEHRLVKKRTALEASDPGIEWSCDTDKVDRQIDKLQYRFRQDMKHKYNETKKMIDSFQQYNMRKRMIKQYEDTSNRSRNSNRSMLGSYSAKSGYNNDQQIQSGRKDSPFFSFESQQKSLMPADAAENDSHSNNPPFIGKSYSKSKSSTKNSPQNIFTFRNQLNFGQVHQVDNQKLEPSELVAILIKLKSKRGLTGQQKQIYDKIIKKLNERNKKTNVDNYIFIYPDSSVYLGSMKVKDKHVTQLGGTVTSQNCYLISRDHMGVQKLIGQSLYKHGYGIQVWTDSTQFEGDWHNNKAMGEGILYHSQGHVYTGQFANSIVTGYGEYIHHSQEKNTGWAKYSGEFKDGIILDGHIQEEWQDGTKFVGQYKQTKKHGYGKYTWPKGNIYKGNWEDGKITGEGNLSHKDGDLYNGEFCNGLMHGKGAYKWANGNKYDGEYQNNVRHGQGKYIYSDGSSYNGQWQNGRKHGSGILIYPNGEERNGLWNEGNLIKLTSDSKMISKKNKQQQVILNKDDLAKQVECQEKKLEVCHTQIEFLTMTLPNEGEEEYYIPTVQKAPDIKQEQPNLKDEGDLKQSTAEIITIQTFLKGYLVRKSLKLQKQKIIKIQALIRGFLLRCRMKFLKKLKVSGTEGVEMAKPGHDSYMELSDNDASSNLTGSNQVSVRQLQKQLNAFRGPGSSYNSQYDNDQNKLYTSSSRREKKSNVRSQYVQGYQSEKNQQQVHDRFVSFVSNPSALRSEESGASMDSEVDLPSIIISESKQTKSIGNYKNRYSNQTSQSRAKSNDSAIDVIQEDDDQIDQKLMVVLRNFNIKIKQLLQQKQGIDLRKLRTIFKSQDKRQQDKLSYQDFQNSLCLFGLIPNMLEMQAISRYFDIDEDENICYLEFMRGLHDRLVERRLIIVQKAYLNVDKEKTGQTTISALQKIFDVSMDPQFLAGKKTKEKLFHEFLYNLLGHKQKPGEVIYMQEFIDYYADLSMSIQNSDDFVLKIETTWQVSEENDSTQRQQAIHNLQNELQQKIFQALNKNPKYRQRFQNKELVKEILNKLELNKSFPMKVDDFRNLVHKLKISYKFQLIYPLFKSLDQDNSGLIELNEFEKFIQS